MLDAQDLQAIAQLINQAVTDSENRMKSEFKGSESRITVRLDKMQEDIDILKEDSEITRNGVNTLLDWAEDKSKQSFPIYQKAE